MSKLQTRKPTGKAPWPLILLEGEEKAGKSYACATLSTSPRVGRVLYFDIGEHAADQYGAIAGARYEVVLHAGSYASIVDQLQAAVEEVVVDDEAPPVIIIDSISHLWTLLVETAQEKANARMRKRRRDFAGDASISMDLWNEAKTKWRRVMDLLIAWRGIAIVTARGREVAEVDDGTPTGGSTWKVEGEKTLAYDCDVWVRLRRDAVPALIGARSLVCGVAPGEPPKPLPDFNLEALIFDILQIGGEVGERDFTALNDADVSAAEAKRALVRAVMEAHDLSQRDATSIAATIWKRHDGDGATISQETLEGMLHEARHESSDGRADQKAKAS